MISIIIPTYNERGNIVKLIEYIRDSVIFEYEIIFVDDSSNDGSIDIFNQIISDNVDVIHRKGNRDLSLSVIEGFRVAKGDILAVMDADLSHNPIYLNDMFRLIEEGNDLVVGSRYVGGGKDIDSYFMRRMISKVFTFIGRAFTHIKDPLSGFFMVKRGCIDLNKINSRGFKILLEIIVNGNCNKIKEFPINFKKRKEGKSKANMKEGFKYMFNIIRYSYKEFFKFGIVGLIGVIINLISLYILTEFFGIYYIFSAMISFMIAAVNNYILNKCWTFRKHG